MITQWKYDVATGSNTHKLKDAVEKALLAGWRLQGGVSVCSVEGDGTGRAFYAQALVKTFPPDTD